MGRRDPPTSQDGKTFLRNHAACVASIDHCFFKATAGAAIGDTSAGWQGSLTKRKCDGLTTDFSHSSNCDATEAEFTHEPLSFFEKSRR